MIGETATVALANRFGGTRLYIPLKIGDDHEIALAIGREATTALQVRFSLATIRVPLLRNLRAKQMVMDGWSAARIAVRLGMTETGVARLLKTQGLHAIGRPGPRKRSKGND